MHDMQKGKTLIAYYSMSGHTRALAEEIRLTLSADIEEIREPRQRRGFSGVMSRSSGISGAHLRTSIRDESAARRLLLHRRR